MDGLAMVDYYNVTFHTNPIGGSIFVQYGEFTDGMVIGFGADTYPIHTNPPDGMRFKSWTTSGGVSVASSTSETTTMTVASAGVLQANWESGAPPNPYYDITFHTNPVGGMIGFNGGWFVDGSVFAYQAGTYAIKVVPPSGYVFDSWTRTAGVYVSDMSNPSTTATISDVGTLTANWKGAPPPAGWDVRTTDLWVREIDNAGAVQHSWNILQGQTPEIPTATDFDNIRIDVRLKNFAAASVTVRAVCQTIGRNTGTTGEVIYTPQSTLAPSLEAVQSFTVPMWTEDVYERLWVDNVNLPVGNCAAGQAPPWTGCRQGELFDFNLSSRHLVAINLGVAINHGPPPPPSLECSKLFPNWWNPLSPDFYGNLICVLSKSSYDLLAWLGEQVYPTILALVKSISNIKIEVPAWITDFITWVNTTLPNTLKAMEAWATNPVGEAFKLAAPISEGLYEAANQVLKVTDPFAELFNPNRFQTKIVQDLVRPIYEVLHKGEFNLFELIGATILTAWMPVFSYFEELAVGTAPATYEKAKERAAAIMLAALEINAFITLLRALGKLAPVLVSALEGVADGLTQIIAAVFTIKTASDIYSPGWQASTHVPLERHWKSIALSEHPSPSELMSMRAKGFLTAAEYTTEMKEDGYSPNWLGLLYSNMLRQPSIDAFSTMLRRGKITETEFKTYLENALVSPEWYGYWRELVYSEPNFYLVRQLANTGNLTDAELTNLLKRRGVPPEFLDTFKTLMLQASGASQRRTTLGVMARLVVAKLRTEADFYAYADSAHIPHSMADPILQAEKLRGELGGDTTERAATLAMWNEWYLLDIVDEAEWRTGLVALGFDSDTIAHELAYLKKKKTPVGPTTEREATRAMYDTWYLQDVIDADTWRAAYTDLKYDADTIARQLAYLDKRKQVVEPPPPTPREATLAMWGTWYTEDIVNATEYRAGLTALNYPVGVIDRELALLDKGKIITPPPPPSAEATLAMWNTWYSNGIKTAPEYIAWATAKGYDMDTITAELAYLDSQNVAAQRDLLESEALKAYKDKVIDELTLRARLEKLGRTPDAIDVLVATANAEMATAEREVSLTIYADAYRYGAMDRPTYLAKLIDAGYTDEKAQLIITTKELSWATGAETLTAEQILNSWEQGFLTFEDTQTRLTKRGWTTSDLRIRMSFSVIDMLKAKHITNAQADKFWTDLAVGPDERVQLLAWYGWTLAP